VERLSLFTVKNKSWTLACLNTKWESKGDEVSGSFVLHKCINLYRSPFILDSKIKAAICQEKSKNGKDKEYD
jgi:hypothetical protein